MGKDMQSILNILFPSRCVGCDLSLENGEVVCRDCLASVAILETFTCGRCGSRLPFAKKVCHRDVPYLLAAAGSYADPTLRALIHALKFDLLRGAAVPLGRLAAAHLRALPFDIGTFTMIPVPLGRARERERGFNQSLLIAEVIRGMLGIPLRPELLFRTRNTKPQSDLSHAADRRANVRGSFAAIPSPLLKGARVLLVDDVTTSGATLHEAARALKAAGVRRIISCVLAKA